MGLDVAQEIIACYNGATAKIETMQQPLSFEKVRQVFDPFWQKVKQETHIPIHILWQLVSFTAATDGAYVREQVSLFGREASVRGHSHGGGGGDGGIADVYLKNGKPCKQYFLLAMYSLFSSAKVTVACGAQSAAGEGATVFGLLHELRKETPLATGIPSSKIFLSVVADHAPVLHRLILSFGGNYYSHAEHAITCEPSEQTQIKARFDRKTMKLEIVSTVSRDSSSSLSSLSLRMKYPIHPEASDPGKVKYDGKEPLATALPSLRSISDDLEELLQGAKDSRTWKSILLQTQSEIELSHRRQQMKYQQSKEASLELGPWIALKLSRLASSFVSQEGKKEAEENEDGEESWEALVRKTASKWTLNDCKIAASILKKESMVVSKDVPTRLKPDGTKKSREECQEELISIFTKQEGDEPAPDVQLHERRRKLYTMLTTDCPPQQRVDPLRFCQTYLLCSAHLGKSMVALLGRSNDNYPILMVLRDLAERYVECQSENDDDDDDDDDDYDDDSGEDERRRCAKRKQWRGAAHHKNWREQYRISDEYLARGKKVSCDQWKMACYYNMLFIVNGKGEKCKDCRLTDTDGSSSYLDMDVRRLTRFCRCNNFFRELAEGTYDKELKDLEMSTETRTFLKEQSKTLPEGFTVVPSDAAKRSFTALAELSKILRTIFLDCFLSTKCLNDKMLEETERAAASLLFSRVLNDPNITGFHSTACYSKYQLQGLFGIILNMRRLLKLKNDLKGKLGTCANVEIQSGRLSNGWLENRFGCMRASAGHQTLTGPEFQRHYRRDTFMTRNGMGTLSQMKSKSYVGISEKVTSDENSFEEEEEDVAACPEMSENSVEEESDPIQHANDEEEEDIEMAQPITACEDSTVKLEDGAEIYTFIFNQKNFPWEMHVGQWNYCMSVIIKLYNQCNATKDLLNEVTAYMPKEAPKYFDRKEHVSHMLMDVFIWWTKVFQTLQVDVIRTTKVDNVKQKAKIPEGPTRTKDCDADGLWNFCNALQTVFFSHGKRDYTKCADDQRRKPNQQLEKKLGKCQSFFADIFGKGNIDEHAVELWEKNCKTIHKASALLFPTADKELVSHIIALTTLIYGTVDCAEYIFNFGENFKQLHVASFLKTEAVQNFIAWFKDKVKVDNEASELAVSLIVSSMTAYRVKQVLRAEKYFHDRESATKQVTFRAAMLAQDSFRSAEREEGKEDKKKEENGEKRKISTVTSGSGHSSKRKERQRQENGVKRRRHE